jgi:hypothetical protein
MLWSEPDMRAALIAFLGPATRRIEEAEKLGPVEVVIKEDNADDSKEVLQAIPFAAFASAKG